MSIVDVRLPPTLTDEGLRAAVDARRATPGLPVLVLSQHVEELYARELLAESHGAIGYLLKDRVFSDDQFLDAVRAVAGGGTVMDPPGPTPPSPPSFTYIAAIFDKLDLPASDQGQPQGPRGPRIPGRMTGRCPGVQPMPEEQPYRRRPATATITAIGRQRCCRPADHEPATQRPSATTLQPCACCAWCRRT